MKAIVDPDVCIGCTQCAGICPEVFSMDGNLAHAIPGEIPGEDASKAAEAEQSCPVDAISLES
jgi:ferredoxin